LDLFQLLYCMWFTDLLDRQTIIEQHRIWGQAAGHFARDEPHDNRSRPRPSPAHWLRLPRPARARDRLLHAADPRRPRSQRRRDVLLLSTARADFLTERLKASAHHWIDTHALDDDQLAERIRADRIDVLIDLSLQMTFSRLMLFTRRPAPVQATYLAYPGTSGLPQMDYRITDRIMEPASRPDGWLGPERLARLSECYWCYRPPPQAPPPAAAPPSARNGYITSPAPTTS
jgi:hypothetical protein